MAMPKQYRSIEEFAREELRPGLKAGYHFEDLMQDTHQEGTDLLFDDTFDAYDPDNFDFED